MKTCKELLERQLWQNETLLWCGKPRQGIIFRGSDIIEIPVSAATFGFISYWLYLVVTGPYPMPFIFYMAGIIFFMFSSYSLLGRFYTDRNFRKRICYGVTTERILIDYGSPYNRFRSFSAKMAIPDIPTQSFQIKELPKIELNMHKNLEYGTITFGLPFAYSSSWGLGIRGGGSAVLVKTEFSEIDEPEKVYELLIKMKSNLITKVEPVELS